MTTRFLPFLSTILSAAIAWGAVAAAQQEPAAAKALPFAQGVQLSVVAAKPARIKGGDWDDKVQKIVLTLKLVNKDLRQAYEGYTATVSVFGESVFDSKCKKVLIQEAVDISLPAGKTQEHVCAEVTTRFDKTGSKFGYFYDGWIIVVKDPQGKIVQVKSTSAGLEKFTELAAKIEEGKCYDSKLKVVKGYVSK